MNDKLKTIFICSGVGIVLLCGAFFFGIWTGGNNSRATYSKQLHELDSKYASQSVVTASDLSEAITRARTAEEARTRLESDLRRAIATGDKLASASRDIAGSSLAISKSSANFANVVSDIIGQQSTIAGTGDAIDEYLKQLTEGLGSLSGDISGLQGYKQ